MQMSKGNTPVHCTLSLWWTLLGELVRKYCSLSHILSFEMDFKVNDAKEESMATGIVVMETAFSDQVAVNNKYGVNSV